MNTAEAFLADIIANPKDDTPRLIYADWLSDNGDEERAEFIRVQCELTSLPVFDGIRMIGNAQTETSTSRIYISGLIRAEYLPRIPTPQIGQLGGDLSVRLRFGNHEAPLALCDSSSVRRHGKDVLVRFQLLPVVEDDRVVYYREYSDPAEARRLELEKREEELLQSRQFGRCTGQPSTDTRAAARYVWAGPVAKLPDPNYSGWKFTRGFVSDVTCSSSDWLAFADDITEAQPLERVRLTTLPTREQMRVRLRDHPLKDDERHVDALAEALLHGDAAEFLRDVWEGITFTLPQYGQSPILGAYPAWQAMQDHAQPAGYTLPATGIDGQVFMFINQSAEPVDINGIEVAPGEGANCVWADGWQVMGNTTRHLVASV